MGYRVLMHAEVERYFEEVALCSLRSGQNLYKNRGTIQASAAAAISHYQSHLFLKKESKLRTTRLLDGATIATLMPDILDETCDWFERSIVANNNGIKPENLVRLVGYLGIDQGDIDPTLFDALKTFGNERGDAAHLSRREIRRRYQGKSRNAPRIRRLPSPSDEVIAVDAVLALLPSLDRLVHAVSRTIIWPLN
ncbi:HEPN domain-containing protein [Nonomuraea sp. NPDC050783]|uniref:HEPN domain-containing protein n=1 Tax=Nonomuraea sp. NPDC050783 TaxID=3154634 RepID=UPI003465642D